MQEERPIRFHLFGLEYTFYSDAPDDVVDAIIALLREELEDGVTINRSTVPSIKVLVLGCLRMTARYEQLRRKHESVQQKQHQMVERLMEEQHQIVKRLIDKISAELD